MIFVSVYSVNVLELITFAQLFIECDSLSMRPLLDYV